MPEHKLSVTQIESLLEAYPLHPDYFKIRVDQFEKTLVFSGKKTLICICINNHHLLQLDADNFSQEKVAIEIAKLIKQAKQIPYFESFDHALTFLSENYKTCKAETLKFNIRGTVYQSSPHRQKEHVWQVDKLTERESQPHSWIKFPNLADNNVCKLSQDKLDHEATCTEIAWRIKKTYLQTPEVIHHTPQIGLWISHLPGPVLQSQSRFSTDQALRRGLFELHTLCIAFKNTDMNDENFRSLPEDQNEQMAWLDLGECNHPRPSKPADKIITPGFELLDDSLEYDSLDRPEDWILCDENAPGIDRSILQHFHYKLTTNPKKELYKITYDILNATLSACIESNNPQSEQLKKRCLQMIDAVKRLMHPVLTEVRQLEPSPKNTQAMFCKPRRKIPSPTGVHQVLNFNR